MILPGTQAITIVWISGVLWAGIVGSFPALCFGRAIS